LVSNASYLGGGRLALSSKVRLESAFDRHLYAGAFLTLAPLSRHFVETGRRSVARISLVQPIRQQRFQLAHVLEAQLNTIKNTDTRMK